MHPDTTKYNKAQAPADRKICELLARVIDRNLPEAENRIWHAHPVWFLDGNPVVGYSKLKNCVRLLFWSGQSFEEEGLMKEGSFKAAEARYTAPEEVDEGDLERWVAKARDIQWYFDEGIMWPTSFALKKLTGAEEATIGDVLKRALRCVPR
ncbi:MAG: DUF1801 domain-containing protein [Gemmatimonadetes bacterium]|nr:DUF1801 domain-containing protein [Gemmatimonadota bacterium]